MIWFISSYHPHRLSCWDFGGELGRLPAGMREGWGQVGKGCGSHTKSFWVPRGAVGRPALTGHCVDEAQKEPKELQAEHTCEAGPGGPLVQPSNFINGATEAREGLGFSHSQSSLGKAITLPPETQSWSRTAA